MSPVQKKISIDHVRKLPLPANGMALPKNGKAFTTEPLITTAHLLCVNKQNMCAEYDAQIFIESSGYEVPSN